jgi:hydrogenase maturation protease
VRARVIGLGQDAAGDDAVGLAVLERLRERGVPEGVELVRADEESALIPLLDADVPVVLVDAVLAGTPGEILELAVDDLAAHGARPVSTHGIGVVQAVELARLVNDRVSPSIRIVGVSIERPRQHELRLSPSVAAAVSLAADRVLALVGA